METGLEYIDFKERFLDPETQVLRNYLNKGFEYLSEFEGFVYFVSDPFGKPKKYTYLTYFPEGLNSHRIKEEAILRRQTEPKYFGVDLEDIIGDTVMEKQRRVILPCSSTKLKNIEGHFVRGKFNTTVKKGVLYYHSYSLHICSVDASDSISKSLFSPLATEFDTSKLGELHTIRWDFH